MKKFKSIVFYLFVAAGISAAVYGYFYLKQNKKPAINAIDVLPSNAICVFGSSNFHELANKLSNQSLIWNELINIPEFNNIHTEIQYFDSLISEVEILKEYFTERKINLALYKSNTASGILITFNLKDLTQHEDFSEAIEKTFKCKVSKEGEGEFWNGTKKYNIKISNGVVALSNNKEILVNCFSNVIEKQTKTPGFASLIKNLENNELFNVYINHKLLEVYKKQVNTTELILTGSSVCNIEITPDEITTNGFNECDTTSILNAVAGQPSQLCDFLQALPFNIQSYKAVSINDYALFKKQVGLSNSSKEYWNYANSKALFNCERQVEENIGSKVVETEFGINGVVNKAIVVEIKDSVLIYEALRFLSDSMKVNEGIKNFILNDSIENLAAVMFGKVFNSKVTNAFIFGNYLFLTECDEACLFYINSMVNNSNAAQNELFMAYAKDNLLVNFNYQAYYAVSKNKKNLKEIFAFTNDSTIKHFNKLSDCSINMSNYKNTLQFRTNIKYQQNSQNKEIPGLWTCEADTAIISEPSIFTNHKSGENELLMQDSKNTLYLVNATGNIIWKKPISEQAISEFYTVDAFKNNKFQILFNTANFIHLIDRNGNYVPGYPVKIPSGSANAMSLFDYDNTKDYRLILASNDKRIYNYNINGTRNEKFTPIRTDEIVSKKVKYIKVGASDYLIAIDTEGKIYVYSRRGEGRIDLTNRLITNYDEFYVDASNNIQSTSIIYFDDKNSLIGKIKLDDKKEAVKAGADFDNGSYFFELIDDDKKTDLVISDKSKVLCYDFSGNELFRYESEDENIINVSYYYDSDGAYFIINNSINEIVVLGASSKKIVKKIIGTAQPIVSDLFKDGKKYLIVPDGNTLKCVLMK